MAVEAESLCFAAAVSAAVGTSCSAEYFATYFGSVSRSKEAEVPEWTAAESAASLVVGGAPLKPVEVPVELSALSTSMTVEWVVAQSYSSS